MTSKWGRKLHYNDKLLGSKHDIRRSMEK